MTSYKDFFNAAEKYEKVMLESGGDTNDRFEYYQNRSHPLNKEMKETILLAEQNFDDQVCFVVLDDNVMMVIATEEQLDFDKFESFVHKECQSSIYPADFGTMVLGDTALAVQMGAHFFFIFPDSDDSENIPLGKALEYRQEIIDASEKEIIYGVAVGKSF